MKKILYTVERQQEKLVSQSEMNTVVTVFDSRPSKNGSSMQFLFGNINLLLSECDILNKVSFSNKCITTNDKVNLSRNFKRFSKRFHKNWFIWNSCLSFSRKFSVIRDTLSIIFLLLFANLFPILFTVTIIDFDSVQRILFAKVILLFFHSLLYLFVRFVSQCTLCTNSQANKIWKKNYKCCT